jgi:hypothetical protein
MVEGITYTLLESTTANPATDQFTLEISGINGSGDTQGGRTGVNAFAFNQPAGFVGVPVVPTGFMVTMGGLNSNGCNMSGNFFCFKATTPPQPPPTGTVLPANSMLSYTFDVTAASASDFQSYDPAFKIEWVGSKNNYSLVSQPLTPTPVPLPAALPLLFSAIAGLGFLGRRKTA